MHFPDRHRSSALFIAGIGAEHKQLEAIMAALTHPVFGGFAADRCRLLVEPPTDEALAVLDEHIATTRDTLLVYFAGQLAVDSAGQVGFVDSEPHGLSGFRNRFQRTPTANSVVLVDCVEAGATDAGAIAHELRKGVEHAQLLAAVTSGGPSKFGNIVLQCLRDGVPDGPETVSLDLLTEQCRGGAGEPVIRTGSFHDVGLVRNRALINTAEAEFSMLLAAASPAARALLCRAALLEPDDHFDAAILLPEFTSTQITEALREVAGNSLLAPDGPGGGGQLAVGT